MIDDTDEGEHFSARVTVERPEKPCASEYDTGKFEFADIFIVGLSDRPGLRGVTFTQNESNDVVATEFNRFDSFHSHFILFDLNGNGLYVRRNRFKKDLEKRACSIWDLGNDFGNGVADAMRQLGPWDSGSDASRGWMRIADARSRSGAHCHAAVQFAIPRQTARPQV